MGSRVRRRPGELRIGTSGYQYPHWRGLFYPGGLPTQQWFDHYVTVFDTVEINNTFYQLPAATTFDHWRERAPAGFRYALKLSRYATHQKRLKDPRRPLRRFLERAVRLQDRLGPVLVQLPPRWDVRPERLETFLSACKAIAGRSHVRWAVELRDPRWLCHEIFAILERHRAALCVHDLIEGHPLRLTADWTYLRFHGVSYGGRYHGRSLARWAGRIREHLDEGRDVWVYFNNDREAHAPRDASRLRSLLTP